MKRETNMASYNTVKAPKVFEHQNAVSRNQELGKYESGILKQG